MCGNRFFQDFCVVGHAVASGSKAPNIDPGTHRRRIWDVGFYRLRQRVEWSGLVDIPNRGNGADVLKTESMREDLYMVGFSTAGNLPPAFSVGCKNGNISTEHVLHINLGARVVLVTDDDRWA